MITKDEDGNHVVIMGCGDIEVTAGFVDDPAENYGLVAFIPQEPREIGSPGQRYKEDGECELLTGEHVRLVFTDHRSIGVVIEQLQKCREIMLADTEG